MIKKYVTIGAIAILSTVLAQCGTSNITLENVDKVRENVWQEYIKDVSKDNSIKENFEKRQVVFEDSVMKYEMFTIGEKPDNGYPLYITLHGGGGVAEAVNNDQWAQMQNYYRTSVDNGVYVAVRGIADEWNMHFQDNSYPLYDDLIETMIAFADVDPNRVYFLGFSAGGDGVYQITPRLADRIAAANMSAGHPNGVSLKNLFNTPFLLQVGEDDTAYDRSKEVARYCRVLCDLQDENDGYIHDAFIHIKKPHNFRDNDSSRANQVVSANVKGWLAGEDNSSKEINTNAVDWVSQYERNPYPNTVIWDLGTKGELRDINSFYWLRVDNVRATSGYIKATLDKDNNSIIIDNAEINSGFTILLNNKMLDIFKPIKVYIEDKEFEITVEPSKKLLIETTYERGDKDYQFEAGISVKKVNKEWQVSPLEVQE